MTKRLLKIWKKKYWRRFLKLSKKKYFFIFLFFLLLVVALFFIFWSQLVRLRSFWKPELSFVNSAVPNIEKSVPSPFVNANLPPNVLDPSLIFGTFFDTFSGVGFIDQEKTTMYRDRLAAAMFFRPDYSFELSDNVSIEDQEYFQSVNVNDSSLNAAEVISDKRCLKTDCLEQKGQKLYYNGESLVWPEELEGLKVVAVSIGALTDNFLIGFTVKDSEPAGNASNTSSDVSNNDVGTSALKVSENKDRYRGLVFYFDGQEFTLLKTPEPIISPYFGFFGFGGEEADFLVIYGAYKGIAYRFQDSQVKDISRFFDIRIMGGGFKAEAIKAGEGERTTWYVFSLTAGQPRLIKLWQNRTPEIVGEASFDTLFSADVSSAIFKLKKVDNSAIVLLANIKKKNQEEWRFFADRGFYNSQSGVILFKPVFQGLVPETITIKKLAVARLDLDSPSATAVKFLFSPDGQNWQVIPAGKNVDFNISPLDNFFLRIVFPDFSDKFYSPFLASALFDYYYQK
jgi:hypothetical protein